MGLLSARYLSRGRPEAVPTGVAAGSALTFLGLMDLAYDLQQGKFDDRTPAMAIEAAIVTISLTLGPEADKQEGFAFIAQIHSGDDRTQLVIGRWSEYLIVMNGDDYKHRLKHPRISARLSETHLS